MKSDKEFLFTAPVMIPETPDCDYDRGEKLFTAEEIQFFKESFEDYRIIDKNHQVFLNGGSAKSIGQPVDSFLLEKETTYMLVNGDTETYPKGTWMLTTNVTDPKAQKEINDGILTGYSPSIHREEIGRLIKKAMAIKASQGQLIKDIPNPNTITVSIVRKPCQSGSKQCKLGSDYMGDDKKTLDKIRELLGGNSTPEFATKEDFDALAKQLREEHDAALKSLSEDIGEKVNESIAEALGELGAIKSGKPEDDLEDDFEDDPEDNPEGDGEPNPEPEEDEDEDDEKKKKNKKTKKGGSKQGSIHNGGATKENYDPELDTYAFLGRNPNGTVKRK